MTKPKPKAKKPAARRKAAPKKAAASKTPAPNYWLTENERNLFITKYGVICEERAKELITKFLSDKDEEAFKRDLQDLRVRGGRLLAIINSVYKPQEGEQQ